MRKTFLIPQFGKPHDWTQEYLENIAMLEPYGWEWKIFTPNKLKAVGKNTEIIPMNIEEFDALMEEKIGVNPRNRITEKGFPFKPVSDYMPAHGKIFEDYIKDYDMWGHTNWDMIYGRLDHFIPDSFLETVDIFGDDPDAINGIFSVYKNNEFINTLFKEVPHWQDMFLSERLETFDEDYFTRAVRKVRDEGRIKFASAFYHGYDRTPEHKPVPALHFDKDSSLIETKTGKEIMFWHFSQTKRWPDCL